MLRALSWLGAAALLGAALTAFGSRPSIAQGAAGGALTWLAHSGPSAVDARAVQGEIQCAPDVQDRIAE